MILKEKNILKHIHKNILSLVLTMFMTKTGVAKYSVIDQEIYLMKTFVNGRKLRV